MEHVQGHTLHARRGALKNAFTYGVDFALCDLDRRDAPGLLSRNRFNLWSIWDYRHGGERDKGAGKPWFEGVLADHGFDTKGAELLLLTQPSFLWFHFNPVSFWIALRDGKPCVVVAEVNNTVGHRHCYFCAREDFRPIERKDRIIARKVMHVSPFQQVAGHYVFNFDITDQKIDIRISYENNGEGVLATLSGDRRPATNRSLLWAAIRRPFGAARVVALIHWQAVILFIKRAPFRRKPPAPDPLLTDCETFQGSAQ